MKSIKEEPIKGKRVLVRCDLDVPIDSDGSIADDFRITKSLPTIKYLLESNSTLVLLAHLGRPQKPDKKFSLRPVAEKLETLLGQEVKFIEDYAKATQVEGLLLLENLRFDPRELKNDTRFAKQLASLGEVYVNEAFAESHQRAASVVKLAGLLPSYAGINLTEEVEVLTKALESPKRPFIAIIGGAKADTKLPVIKNLTRLSDKILIGGKLISEKISPDPRIIMPEDVVVAKVVDDQIVGDPLVERKSLVERLDSFKIFDLGFESIKTYISYIKEAKTIVWNGPMGVFEDQRFLSGTQRIAEAIVQSQAFSIVGGGDTVFALKSLGWLDKFSHVSTGGGAMLAFLAGEKLPGIDSLG